MSEMHDEGKLPKWAQSRLNELRTQLNQAQGRATELRKAHAVLENREWFTIPAPHDVEQWPDGSASLFYLVRNDACRVATLGKDDVLLVGRAKKLEKGGAA